MPDYNPTIKVTEARTKRDLYEMFERWPEAELLAITNANDSYQTVEVAFLFKDAPVRISYGRLGRRAENIRAIFLTLEDIRMTYKRGLGDVLTGTVSQMLKLGAGAQTRDPYEVLGVRPNAPLEVIEASHRALAKTAHPDVPGGSDDAMKELNDALDRIRSDRAVPS